ncbi:perlucin-like [Mytilus trossulus]|uniref:perlucin-like n=1 Tax=Mytilus trossulus TaxID=6551 RepID=UPI003007ABED
MFIQSLYLLIVISLTFEIAVGRDECSTLGIEQKDLLTKLCKSHMGNIEGTEYERNERKRECPSGWLYYDDYCYLFSSGRGNWETARRECRGYNAKLAEPINKDHTDYLIKMANKINKGVHYWLGGRDVIEGVWRWNSGKKIWYKPWSSPNQPDNAHGREDCLEMQNCRICHWKWNDRPCYYSNNYVCQKRSTCEHR